MRSGGFGCRRIRSDPITRAWEVHSPLAWHCQRASPASLVGSLWDLLETLRPEHRVGAEIREAPCALGSASLAQRGWASAPRPLPSPAPSLCASGRPLWLLAAWRVGSSAVGGLCQPLHWEGRTTAPALAGLPPVHLAANATSGTVRLPARCPASVCLRVQSRGSVCPHRRRTEQGRRQSYVRGGGRGGRGGAALSAAAAAAEAGRRGAPGTAADGGGMRLLPLPIGADCRTAEARRQSRGRSQPGRPRTAVGAPRHGPSREGGGPGRGATAAAAASGGYAGARFWGRAG